MLYYGYFSILPLFSINIGALVLDKTELHMITVATHFLDDSIMGAVVSNDMPGSILSAIERYLILVM